MTKFPWLCTGLQGPREERCREYNCNRIYFCVQASKGLEKKGAKLLSLEASAQAKASQAEARMEAKAAARRKRQEEKQAEKAELKRLGTK